MGSSIKTLFTVQLYFCQLESFIVGTDVVPFFFFFYVIIETKPRGFLVLEEYSAIELPGLLEM